MWLVAASQLTDPAHVRETKPALWRELRRFNAPIQLAVAAAHDVLPHVKAPSQLAIISLAPCHSGSPELHRWVRDIEAGGAVKMNPTHTLHAVDNLALSVLSLSLGARGWSMSLGGAAGMFWTALELALERDEREVLIVGGDQTLDLGGTSASGPDTGTVRFSDSAFAMLLSRERAPFAETGQPARLVQIIGSVPFSARIVQATGANPDIGQDATGTSHTAATSHTVARSQAHAARGAIAMLDALRGAHAGALAYAVPRLDGDGIDDVVVCWEVGA